MNDCTHANSIVAMQSIDCNVLHIIDGKPIESKLPDMRMTRLAFTCNMCGASGTFTADNAPIWLILLFSDYIQQKVRKEK